MSPVRTRLIAVGACAIDIILSVPHFPQEDSKLRATSLMKRRGGNTPNSLEVLQQLVSLDSENDYQLDAADANTSSDGQDLPRLELFLIATLPSRTSEQTAFIASSFNRHDLTHTDITSPTLDSSRQLDVNLSHCIYRENFSEPISSYIISSQSNSSRTIINSNVLPEMTLDEFKNVVRDLLESKTNSSSHGVDQIWFHFEGRIPYTIIECIRYLRSHVTFTRTNLSEGRAAKLVISVELEKPGREGLQELAYLADVVFYSKSWAEGEGYASAEACVVEQSEILKAYDGKGADERLLICTWGAQGACAMTMAEQSGPGTASIALLRSATGPENIIHSSAYAVDDLPIVDTTGMAIHQDSNPKTNPFIVRRRRHIHSRYSIWSYATLQL